MNQIPHAKVAGRAAPIRSGLSSLSSETRILQHGRVIDPALPNQLTETPIAPFADVA